MEYLLKALAVLLVAAGGSFIQRVTGFGFGIFAMIFLPYITGQYIEATVLSSAMSLISTIYVSFVYRKSIKWKLVLPCVVCSMVTTVLAVKFMSGKSSDVLCALLGGVLILLSIYYIFWSGKLKPRESLPASAVAGGLSGIMGSLFAMAGPPMVIYITGVTTSKLDYIATIQCFFCLNGMFTLGVKAFAGYFTLDVVKLVIPGIGGLFAGNFIGGKVYDRLDSGKLKKAIYIFMAISGAVTLINSLIKLFGK